MTKLDPRQKKLRIGYIPLSFGLFGGALLILLCLLIIAVKSNGSLQASAGKWGLLGLLMSAAGFVIPLYAHFIVAMDEVRKPWLPAAVCSGVLLLVYAFFYFLGL